jgi:hypothetical protein
MSNEIENSELNRLIPPEIKNDELYLAIQKIAKNQDIKTILEIGSSSGEGSTKALVTGMGENSSHPRLFCLEISQPRFLELQKRYSNDTFVKCYHASSVSVAKFPNEAEIIEFYNNNQTALNNYPVEQVLIWLQQDIQYAGSQKIQENGIQLIQQENQISIFDFVLIDGSEFTGKAELDEVYGANFIALDDINTFKNYSNYQRLQADSNYTLIAENQSLRHGYAIFQKNPDLPIHFFTIVLNGEPFIRYHIEIFKQLLFPWHWHIIEGVADLKNDTAWSVKNGGRVIDDFHHRGRSNDGTSAYLDELAQLYPDSITIYRQPEGKFWDGKREMVNAPLGNISEPCLLWQIDADELWTAVQINRMRQMFIANPEKRAAFYWCWYFVGANLVVSTRNCYSQNPASEWQRTWRYLPGLFWEAHEPPMLVETLSDGRLQDLAKTNVFTHEETAREGLIFQHFAYVKLEQAQFKEYYYGYPNAAWEWINLQLETEFPVKLRNYFSWVQDETEVDTAAACQVKPLAWKQAGNWHLLATRGELPQPAAVKQPFPKIVIDGVYFQFFNTEINLAWQSWLAAWQQSGFAEQIVWLDRGGTTPKIPGIRYRWLPLYDANKAGTEAKILEYICQEEGADLFASSYYTALSDRPYLLVLYDLPDLKNMNLAANREKYYALDRAYAYTTISEEVAWQLTRTFPQISPGAIASIGSSDRPWQETAATLARIFTQVAEQIKTNHRWQQPLLWSDFRQLQGKYQQAQDNWRLSSTILQQTQAQLQATTAQLEATQAQLHQAEQEILGMKSSKFWQMRSQWFKLRRALGLKSE